MAECIQCFKEEHWTRSDGSVHYHKEPTQILCGSCVQKLLELTREIPWNKQLEEVINPRINGIRRRT